MKIEKGEGFNASENYLKYICERSFLSLWSYPNVFRSQAKELCDLLVVFGDDIIIFSDKWCEFPNTGDLQLDWQRWFRRAVAESAYQVWGAEAKIKKHPENIFLDSKCTNRLPVKIQVTENTKFHLVLVAHGAAKRCVKEHGGSGSLMFRSDIKNIETHSVPFIIGDLDISKTFVHVLDDTTLDILMSTRDTLTDFIDYLNKREALFRSKLQVFHAGEEEMLAVYLQNVNQQGEHDFLYPGDGSTSVAYVEGNWEEFKNHPKRLTQIEENKVSYVWDGLIEEFAKNALNGTQYAVPEGGIGDTEKALRFMAAEPRFLRRGLAEGFLSAMEITPSSHKRIRVWKPLNDEASSPYYAFLLYPSHTQLEVEDYDRYRRMRGYLLESVCLVVRLKYPNARHVIGIATESGMGNGGRSEDLIYFDCSVWDESYEERAKIDQRELQILVNPTETYSSVMEYPEVKNFIIPKNPRNKFCPCGSDKKYKHCHGQ